MYKKLHKEFCEIENCDVTDSNQLHHHHIIERTEIDITESYFKHQPKQTKVYYGKE